MQIKKYGKVCPVCGRPPKTPEQQRCHERELVDGWYWEDVPNTTSLANGQPRKDPEHIINM